MGRRRWIGESWLAAQSGRETDGGVGSVAPALSSYPYPSSALNNLTQLTHLKPRYPYPLFVSMYEYTSSNSRAPSASLLPALLCIVQFPPQVHQHILQLVNRLSP